MKSKKQFQDSKFSFKIINPTEASLILFLNSCRVRPKISHLREAAPLLDLDRDERKLEAFLQLHKHDLLVADLRIFLPFTINLDPYLRKVLKGEKKLAHAKEMPAKFYQIPLFFQFVFNRG